VLQSLTVRIEGIKTKATLKRNLLTSAVTMAIADALLA